jgi:hypothetical protein
MFYIRICFDLLNLNQCKRGWTRLFTSDFVAEPSKFPHVSPDFAIYEEGVYLIAKVKLLISFLVFMLFL